MSEAIEVSAVVTATAPALFDAWIDPVKHSAFTKAAATNDPRIGGAFSAWDGYIWGTNQIIEAPKRLVQYWRTTEFAESAPDSLLEVIFEPQTDNTNQTTITIRHRNIPDGQGADYRQGWIDYYFEPLRHYFESV